LCFASQFDDVKLPKVLVAEFGYQFGDNNLSETISTIRHTEISDFFGGVVP
jgi:hypothetical protein